MNVIEIDKLTKNYGKSRGIIDVSFSVGKGEIFGFIGPNGAGKSTTIRTLLGYIKPDSGRAGIFGLDIAKDTVTIKKRTGYLPSEAVFTENMKVSDMLFYTAKFYGANLKERIRLLASKLDLDLGKRVDDLSLGNRKKVAIIQALMHSPELLILDEPTSGLDPLVQKEFFDILLEQRSSGTTILFSSHVLSEVQRYCDRVAIIREGRIVGINTVEELTSNTFKRVSLIGENGEPREYVHHGDVNKLAQELAKMKLRDFKVEEPSLEEIFLKYYEKEA
ncbi:MAG TPA: ABC transporter ATP-binding protein [Clostridia bacterium]|nr:ABC transporter ATP-binding protein [Clostridia bacterium]